MYLADIKMKVTVKESDLQQDKLTLTVFDSLSDTGETVIEAPIYGSYMQPGAWSFDKLYLGHRTCFYLTL